MVFTIDQATDIGKVRLMLWDLDSTKPIFPDDTYIQTFLDIEGDVKNAAALAMETIAGNRLLVLQYIQLLDLKTDGLSVAEGLLSVAERLRTAEDNVWSGIEIAQVADTPFQWREVLCKQFIRGL